MGKNIKQLNNVSAAALTDILYEVQSDTDYNITLQQIKTLFNIDDAEAWQTKTIVKGTTEYIEFGDSTVYGAVEIEYLCKRTSRGQRTGTVTLLVDDSADNGLTVSDFRTVSRKDENDQGLTIDVGRLSGGLMQLDCVADDSDANPVVFNYKIKSKRKLTIT